VSSAAAARVLAAGAAWRLTGAAAAGRALLAAVSRGGETERTAAAIMLVRAGDRSVPLVRGALLDGSASLGLVEVLGSIGTDDAKEALRRVAHAPGSRVAAPAREAAADTLRTLDGPAGH
jgi:hypothetical protein